MQTQPLYTQQQLADSLGVSRRFIRHEIDRGHLMRSQFLHGMIRERDVRHWMTLREDAIGQASDFIVSDDAKLVQRELQY